MRRRKLVLFGMALLCAYFVYAIVSAQIEIYKENRALNALLARINEKQLENDELSRIVVGEGEDAYIERIAREKLGYAAADERIFEDASGTGGSTPATAPDAGSQTQPESEQAAEGESTEGDTKPDETSESKPARASERSGEERPN